MLTAQNRRGFVTVHGGRSINMFFALANGGGKEGFFYNDWAKEPGVAISCCNDGLRPVIFKLEATDEESVKDF